MFFGNESTIKLNQFRSNTGYFTRVFHSDLPFHDFLYFFMFFIRNHKLRLEISNFSRKIVSIPSQTCFPMKK